MSLHSLHERHAAVVPILFNESLSAGERDLARTCETPPVLVSYLHKSFSSLVQVAVMCFSCPVYVASPREGRPTCDKRLTGLSLITRARVTREIKLILRADVRSRRAQAARRSRKQNHLHELERDGEESRARRFITSAITVNRHPAGLAYEPLMAPLKCPRECARHR